MRRLGLGLLCLVLLAVPGLASAQATFPIAAPNGTIVYSDASFSVSNTAASTAIFKYIVPAAYIATATAQPQAGGRDIFTNTPTNLPVAIAPQPIKLMMVGNLRTNQGVGSPGTIDIGVNFGGSVATLALANAVSLPGSCIDQPVTLEVWIAPLATTTATPTSPNSTVAVNARFIGPGVPLLGAACQTGASSFATATFFNQGVIGTTNLASPTMLSVEWKWSSGTGTNSVIWNNRVLKIGN